MISSLAVALGLLTAGYADDPKPAAEAPKLPYLHPLFTDHAVLQRDVPLPVWGWADPGARVRAALAGQWVETTADAAGKWQVELGPYPAGGPHTLKVTGPRDVEVVDLMVGDVWICSGQSNMEWPVRESNDPEAEIKAADHPKIRLFTVPHRAALAPQATVEARWDVCSPTTIGEFSAVGYFFGREIEREVGVPVGLIDSSWGGTIAEAWMDGEAVERVGDFDQALARIKEAAAQPPGERRSFDQLMAAWWKQNDPGSKAAEPWSSPTLDTAGWKTMDLPGNWEGRGLPDFDGVAWFRREVALPDAWDGKPVRLRLGAIDDRDTTFLNGVEVGHRDVWNARRDFKVPAGVARAGRNVIAVRVFDKQGLGGLVGPAEEMRLELAEGAAVEPIPLAGAWLYQTSARLEDLPTAPEQDEDNPNRVTVLYNGMIAPLVPYAIKGALWYQGESNSARAAQYRRLLPELIRDWRGRFAVGDFPFLIVQLANYMKRRDQPEPSNWAELREAQYLTTKAVPNAQVALAIDIGEADDIHPRNKREVGRRLALGALAGTYGRPVEASGPTFRSIEVHDNSVRLSFDHVAGGLRARGGGKLEGFAIASKDGVFRWADAVIDGNGVVVSSTEVDKPVAVRYAWADNPACNLENGAGLPAVPFRTDAPEPGE